MFISFIDEVSYRKVERRLYMKPHAFRSKRHESKGYRSKRYVCYLLLGIICLISVPQSFAGAEGNSRDSPLEGEPLPASVTGIMNNTRYDHAWWGILVEDLDTGEVIYQVNPEKKCSLRALQPNSTQEPLP